MVFTILLVYREKTQSMKPPLPNTIRNIIISSIMSGIQRSKCHPILLAGTLALLKQVQETLILRLQLRYCSSIETYFHKDY